MSEDRIQATERPRPTSSGEEVVTTLRLALEDLPAQQQAAIRLALVDRLTVPEIATRLGETAASIRDAMRNGLLSLRDALDVVDPSPMSESETLDA